MALDAGTLSTHGTALLQAGSGEFARESYLAEHLPYFALADDDVMVLREGDLLATLRLDGLNPMTTEDARLDALKRAVAAIVAQTGNAFGFYIHRISVPQDLGMRPIEGDSFAAAIDARWQAHVKDLRPAKRQLYLSVIRRPDISARIPLLRALARKAWVKDRATRMQELNEVMGFFEVALSSANPVRLTRTGGEWLGYLNTLNAGSFSPIAFGQSALPLSHTLSNCRATFDGGVVTLTDAVTGQVKYGALFSMKTYPALTDVTLLDALDLPLDIVLTNSFSPIPNNIMAERIQRIIRQMYASDDAAVSLREQLGQAADDQEAGRIAFGDHHLSIAVYAPDRDTLERAAAQIKRVGQEIMSVIVRENMALKATYFAQSPGNFGYRARKTPISSINFADFAALHGSVEGRGPDQSPWGQTISVLPTVGTSGYRFNFHETGSPGKEPTVGHTLVLGRTGTGKTLTTAFLAAQAQRVGARLFFFDKDRGLEMAVRALGGRYNEIRAGVPTGLNPLMTETDERGRAWLSDWLVTLLTQGGTLTGEQSRHIQSAVTQNAHAGSALQKFSSFETLFQSLDDDGELQSRVAEWAPGGRYGWVFEAPEHGAGLELAADIIGFDMTEILDMTTERMAVLSYIFRQIERVVEDRRPTIIVLDEAWKLLDDPYFGARLENWLVTLRKMNCVVIMMTQYPSQLRDSRVGKTIVETVPTQILFPNDRATVSDYDFLRVNAKEAALLVQPTIGQRIALVRSAGDSVFVDADLSAFGTVVSPRGELDATRTGIADIGLVVSAFHADRMPLPSISFVTPFVTSDLTLNAQTYDQLTSEFPAMRENWERFDMEFLGHMGVIRSYAILSDVPIQSVEDFDGLKFSGAGLNLRWIEGIGATGVPSALTSFYSDVESGVTDGMIAWADAITPFRLCEAASYLLRADMGAVTSFAVAANADAWADLPEEVQTVMREVTPLYRDELSRVTTEGDARGVDACIEQGGEVFDLPADERERWASALPPIALEWAADADAQGLPGTEVLSRYMEIMREADQPIARDWDQE